MGNPFSLKGRRYLITGAASGIGRAAALAACDAGAELELADINVNGLAETIGMIREMTGETLKASPTCADLTRVDFTRTEDIKTFMDDIVRKRGKLNGLVHCAGVPYISPLRAISMEQFDKVFRINTAAALELAKSFSRTAICETNEVTSSIVFISSVYANVGSSCNAGYAASKAALHGITRSLAIELAPKRIRVNCVAPGFIDTKMKESVGRFFDEEHDAVLRALHPLGLGEPEDIAYAVQYLLSDAAKWVTGAILNADGGFTAQ